MLLFLMVLRSLLLMKLILYFYVSVVVFFSVVDNGVRFALLILCNLRYRTIESNDVNGE